MAKMVNAEDLAKAMGVHNRILHVDHTTVFGVPIVDAEPVVRCKDCKYYEETDSRIGTCLLTVSGAGVNGFCSWAERREDEK